MNGKASPAPVRLRHYSPSEFAGALAEMGIGLCADSIRRRCGLPVGDPSRIATNPAFAGRHYIPETELFRLVGIQSEVTA